MRNPTSNQVQNGDNRAQVEPLIQRLVLAFTNKSRFKSGFIGLPSPSHRQIDSLTSVKHFGMLTQI